MRAAAPRLRPFAPRMRPLQLRLAACVRFELLPGPIASASTASASSCCSMFAACVRFSCCSRSHPLRLLLPDCVHFECCSPIACIRLQPQLDSSPMFSNILRGVRGSVNKLKYKSTKVARHYSLVPPHEHPTSVTHRQTHRHTLKS